MNASIGWPQGAQARRRAPASDWLIPVLLGAAIAGLLVAEVLWMRGLSLRWLAPRLGGVAPPVLVLLMIVLGLATLFLATAGRSWLPDPGFRLIFLLLVPTQLVGFSLGNIEPLKICLLATVACWLIQSMAHNRSVRLYPPFLMMWLVILIFSTASIVNGLVTSMLSQYSILAKFLMFFIVANVVRTPSQLLYAVRLLVALGVMSAILAVVQEAIFYFLQIPLSLDDNASKYWFKETPIGWMIRATGFHPTSQNLSHFLLITCALLLVGPFSRRQRFWGGLVMGIGVFFTFSGNGLLVLGVVLFLVPIFRRPAITLHYLSIVLLLILLAYESGLLEFVYHKYLLPLSGKSAEDRIELLQLGLEVIGRHPVVGIGLNNFGRLSPQPVHNAYMQLITEIGVIPGVLLVLILALIFVRLLIGLRSMPPGPLLQSGKAVLLALTGLALHFMFEPFINSLVSWSIIGFAEATALLLYANKQTTPGCESATLSPARSP